VDWTLDPAFAAPLLGGAIGWLDCQLIRGYPAGDHSILLAEVRGGASGAGTPLLSFDRRLHGTELRSVPRRDGRGSTGAGIVTLD
jgi:flavin reductase (DIM6/NTAB) family NADH-FMN oxidoreductase RutF